MQKPKSYKLRIFSPNGSCASLRNIELNQRVLLRLGSTTVLKSKFNYLELNTIEGIRTSANKILMKKMFDKCKIKHTPWICSADIFKIDEFYQEHKIIIAKHHHSSKGNGIYYIDSQEKMNQFILENRNNIFQYVFERYEFFPKEFRLHIDVNYGCFYACKKFLKEDAEETWHKHSNTSGFMDVNNMEKLPACWNEMVAHCIIALYEMKLHIACFDIICNNNDFVILESNTAPSLAETGINYYTNHITKYYNAH